MCVVGGNFGGQHSGGVRAVGGASPAAMRVAASGGFFVMLVMCLDGSVATVTGSRLT